MASGWAPMGKLPDAKMRPSPQTEHPQRAIGWAARDASGLLSPLIFSTRINGDADVTVHILYCGICHTDLHDIKNEWGLSNYPIVPGHEIVGEVIVVGCNVTSVKLGDRVGVGCMVGSCRSCSSCLQDAENYCPEMISICNCISHDGTPTYGGYSNLLVVNEHFVVRIPDCLPLPAAAPLLCAGITVYSPLTHFGLTQPGLRLGVVGLGGLGHVAVKFAKAFGVNVTVISTSPSKKQDALQRLGADEFILSHDMEKMQAAAGTLDAIIHTTSASTPLTLLISLLKCNGKLVIVGSLDNRFELAAMPLIMGRKIIAGSFIGGMKECQEMIDFAAKHNIIVETEIISMDYVNTAMERLAQGDVRYRFVIDVGNTLKSA